MTSAVRNFHIFIKFNIANLVIVYKGNKLRVACVIKCRLAFAGVGIKDSYRLLVRVGCCVNVCTNVIAAYANIVS